jgi:hypothetical protein
MALEQLDVELSAARESLRRLRDDTVADVRRSRRRLLGR